MPSKKTLRKPIALVIDKCEANVNMVDCAYKKDLDYLGKMFSDNNKAHLDICARLDKIQFIRLNGDDKTTSFEDMMKEIYHATMSIRKTNKLIEAIKDWMKNTKTGRLIETRIGKITVSFIILWMVISSLNTLGVKHIDPIQFIEWLISHIKFG